MKIMHVLPTLNVGGAETMVVDYLIEMKKLGHDVSIFLLIKMETNLYKKLLDNKISIYAVSNKNNILINLYNIIIRKLFANKIYWKAINEFKPEIIHFHLNMLPRMNEIHKYKKIKLFYTFHSDIERYIHIYGSEWKKTIAYMLENNFMKSFVLSNEMYQKAIKLISQKNIYYLPNGIHLKEYSSKYYNKDKFLKDNNITDLNFLIGHIGRLNRVKNHKKSIDILKYVLKINPKTVLLFVGDGESRYKDELKSYIKDKGLEKNILFLGLRKDISEIISILDVAILPSIKEGFPLTILEYQAHNVRTIVSTAIPRESICNKNCLQLELEKSDEEWANYICGNQINDNTKDLNEFDLNKIIVKLIKYYSEDKK